MNKILLLSLVFFSKFSFGQLTDSVNLKIWYEISIKSDSVKNTLQKDIAILEIGQLYSKYYSYLIYKRDSMMNEDANSGKGMSELLQNMGRYNTGGNPTFIYRQFAGNNFTITSEIATDKFIMSDTLTIKWVIKPDSLIIKGFSCQKATTYFRGRNYIAWFSTSLPVSAGPWKFYGLPGLIMKLADIEDIFNFQLTGIEYLNPKKPMKFDYNGRMLTTRKKFMQSFDYYYNDPVGYMKNVSGLNFVITKEPDQPVKRVKLIKLEME